MNRVFDVARRAAKKISGSISGGEVASSSVVEARFDIVVFFGAGKSDLYQINQWVEVFSVLRRSFTICCLFTDAEAFKVKNKNSAVCKFLAKDIDDIFQFYRSSCCKIILYVNNSTSNFISLRYAAAAHVHINHGESEKSCMSSNQLKAYDFLFLSGSAAYERCANELKFFDRVRVKFIGRPQLDSMLVPQFNFSFSGKAVVYAPTWEGGTSDMDYCTLHLYGLAIVRSLLGLGCTVIYKPHPKIGIKSHVVRRKNAEIINFLKQQGGVEIEDLEDLERKDVSAIRSVVYYGAFISLIPLSDFLIADNSSVVIDWLSFRKPYMLCLNGFDINTRISRLGEGALFDETISESELDLLLKSRIWSDDGDELEAVAAYYHGVVGSENLIRNFEICLSEVVAETQCCDLENLSSNFMI